ncbi:CHASE2 domain-containing protein [Sulfitobacter sp. SK012]|uniref:CHASE2 domain-containing protein n=1 Tax=Sulfitobacter sp. SK012 TaxID=1389005 RepID=UPI0013B44BDC|nr:adenylate/guanylate cyclase domain-containing protein [Sulfitobacter sp. SK012]
MTPIRRAIVASFYFAIVFAWLQPGNQGGALSRFEGRLLDIRFTLRGERPSPADVIILAIDDAAFEKAQTFPLPRTDIGKAIEIATQKGAKAVVLDLLLVGETADDAALASALAAAVNPSIALSLMDEGTPPLGPIADKIADSSFALARNPVPAGPKGTLGPEFSFAQHAQLGHVNLMLEDDGALRRIPVALRLGDQGPVLPSLAVVAARLQSGADPSDMTLISGEMLILGNQRIPLDRQNRAALNFFGPAGTIETWSITRAAEADLAGKLIFIGATSEGYKDAFLTPFDPALPGVEALATMAANVLSQTTLRRDETTWVIDTLLAMIAGLLAAWLASRSNAWVAGIGTLALWSVGLAGLQTALSWNMWLDGATLIGALSIGAILGFAGRWVENKQRAANLSRYQSPQMIEALAAQANPEFDGRMQNAAVLFVDIANFTHQSTQMTPAETGRFLNRFHTIINAVSAQWGGMIPSTAGDGAMIVFGLPNAERDDAARALACADDLLGKFAGTDATAPQNQSIPVRIGGHFGEVYAVILGEEGRSTPTVTGDIVNAASRLQEEAKTHHAVLAISNALYLAAGQPKVAGLTYAGPTLLRGQAKEVDIWLRV